MISHKHKCIFVHIPKVAGKSIKKTYFGVPETGPNAAEFIATNSAPDFLEYPYGHKSIKEYRKLSGQKNYFSFTFVRNPYDRLVSAFFYLDNGGSNRFDSNFKAEYLDVYKGDFNAFVMGFSHRFERHLHFKSQHKWIANFWGKIKVDYVGNFESLDEDMRPVLDKIGLEKLSLEHVNKSEHLAYRSYYSDEARLKVSKIYRKDLKLFNYEF